MLNSSLRVLHISRALRTALRPNGETSSEETALEALAPLLGGDQSEAAAELHRWLEGAIGGRPGDTASLILSPVPEKRKVHFDLHQLGEFSWLLSLEELSAKREEIFSILYKDRLTGAANRTLFEHKLDVAFEEVNQGTADGVTILSLDLDRFKAVNDTLGHAVGDALLALVGERLRTGLRDTDTLARLGGDEFAIIIQHGLEDHRVGELANRLIDLLQRPYLVDGHIVNVGVSIGIARAPEDGRSRSQLLRSADLALYHSKGAGRGMYHFFASFMEDRAQQRRLLELDLRKALLLKQFELHYQPQIDVEEKRVIGLEGLLRWRHPKRGLLLPAEFLPLAEEIGLAIPIGDWVVKTACRDAATWPETMTVAVNVSPLQFESSGFPDAVERVLKVSGLSGNRLEVEVTEEILLRDSGTVRSTLNALRLLAVRVAMDSFGTGLASLSQVVNFPFDKIKIDRSLINSSGGEGKNRAILRAISALGQSLGIATLAEGVETPEHLAHVRAEGCHSVQGFYYSPAVPASELKAFFATTFSNRLATHSPGVSHGPADVQNSLL